MGKITILGAGLAGISTSFHAGHEECILFEKNYYPGGHINTEFVDGFAWDEGPHLSFTKYEYVKQLFAENVAGEYLEYPFETGNYFDGHWIPHPAQSNLFAVPEPLRSRCLRDFLDERKRQIDFQPSNYREWIHFAYGKTFAETFPSAYTKKYWTTPPESLATDWVGKRMYFPSIEDVTQGAKAPLPEQTHYIKSIRYPTRGGYFAYARKMTEGANIRFSHTLTHVSFSDRQLIFDNGSRTSFDILVNTLPLPVLIRLSDAPADVQEAAARLSCTALVIVNVTANHPTVRPEHLIYVYDTDKYSTRINCTEKLSPNNAPEGKTGIQVEVYFSKYRPIDSSPEHIAEKVQAELIEMGLVESADAVESVHTRWVPWANVIFDTTRREAQNVVLDWLEQHGLVREDGDLEPMTDWNKKLDSVIRSDQNLFLAGRYAQWKYFWTDDCVLRGRYVAEALGFR